MSHHSDDDLLDLLEKSPADFYSELEAHTGSDPDDRVKVGELAWRSRERVLEHPEPEDQSLPAWWFHGQRLRFDFRFASMLEAFAKVPDLVERDSLLMALRGFAEVGARKGGLETLEAALGMADANQNTRQVALHGLWLSNEVPYAELSLRTCDLIDELGETDYNTGFRRAAALRKLGRYREAMEAIDEAIELLGTASNDIHQDFVRERELILVCDFLDSKGWSRGAAT